MAVANDQGVEVFTRSFWQTLIQYGVDGPVCHVGSKINKPEADPVAVREARNKTWTFLKNREFVGLDIFDGANVDLIADICSPALFNDHPKLRGHFGFVWCSALLEHVRNPFDAARNIQELLRPGGHLYFVGPWVWGYHAYPDDYWRISFSGIKVLFPDVDFIEWWYMGTEKNVCIRIHDQTQTRERSFMREVLRGQKAAKHITDRAMPYLNIATIGVKR